MIRPNPDQFDTDPDAKQALENVLPFLVELREAEKRLQPLPLDLNKRQAATDLVREKFDLVLSCARSAHIDVNALIAAGERRLAKAGRAAAPSPADCYAELARAAISASSAVASAELELRVARGKLAAAREEQHGAVAALKAYNLAWDKPA